MRARNNVASPATDCGPSCPRSCGGAAGSVRPLGNLLFRTGLQRPQSCQRGEFLWLTTYPVSFTAERFSSIRFITWTIFGRSGYKRRNTGATMTDDTTLPTRLDTG